MYSEFCKLYIDYTSVPLYSEMAVKDNTHLNIDKDVRERLGK